MRTFSPMTAWSPKKTPAGRARLERTGATGAARHAMDRAKVREGRLGGHVARRTLLVDVFGPKGDA